MFDIYNLLKATLLKRYGTYTMFYTNYILTSFIYHVSIYLYFVGKIDLKTLVSTTEKSSKLLTIQ